MHEHFDFLAGGGEMGALIRAKDWSSTALGPLRAWPQSLRSAVSILLPSKAQIVLFWGRELVTLYNDAYRPVFGGKHPRALGLPAREAWKELWASTLQGLFEGVLRTGSAYWAKDRHFYMERHGYPEETYFDVSYDPVRDESGAVGGIFCIVSETTGRVLGERRLKVLRDLAAEPAEARTAEAACALSAGVFGAHPEDVPFALIYLFDPDGRKARLVATAGVSPGEAVSPRELEGGGGPWPLGTSALVRDLGERFAEVPPGPWPEPPSSAMVLPIARRGQRPLGGLVLGISARRAFDQDYRSFLGLVANQVAASIANARAAEEERKRAEALAALDRAKTAFFSNVSHEFRTPLTLMLGPLEDALADAGLPLAAPQAERLEVARRNALRLKKLVNTLLDFSRIEAGRAQASYVETDLPALTADLASTFRSAVEKAGLALRVECPRLPGVAYVDRDMWEKIVLNLLSNALKFTFEGEIAVRVRRHEGRFELAVSDTGTGIPAAELPHLFERFRRVEGARSRTHEGTGIGLALVRELARLHGGTVAVESVAGRGTTFTVSIPEGREHLPAERVDAERTLAPTDLGAAPYLEEALGWLPDPPAFPQPCASGPRARIVWADDNADMREYVRRLLSPVYDVEPVGDGEAALAAVRARRPDLVLADVMMPRLDGNGLLAALRADESTRTLPVVLLSARAGEEARLEGMAAGADDYVVKPFSAKELLGRVAARLEIARAHGRARDTIEEARRALEESDRRKDEFLATLSHELRNPLAPIRHAVQLLGVEGHAVGEVRSIIERQVTHLTRLIDDLLDISRISHARLELRKEPIELSEVVQAAVETSLPVIRQSGHELVVSLPPEPVHLDGDLVRLAQVFMNLLTNAAKYTEPGGRIELAASRTSAEGSGGGAVVVRVKDTGAGISPANLARVFDLFFQADRSLERSHSGLGIGLSLARGLVELHGGTITAHSAGHGTGSEFTVRLPALAQPHRVPATASGKGIRAAPPPRRILIVDDLRDSAESLAMLLRVKGHEVQTAEDGLEALDRAERFLPDVILLDIGMPRLNGYAACRRIREEPWGRDALVIALTGWGGEEDRRKSREAGFDGHLVKPVDPVTVEQLLRTSRASPLA